VKLIDPDRLASVVIWAEAEGEPYETKVAYGELIRNRMAHRFFSDGTVAGTVAKRYQFSEFNDDKGDNDRLLLALNLDDSDPVAKDCLVAWRESDGSNTVPGALMCYAVTIPKPSWESAFSFIKQIGKTRFYAKYPSDAVAESPAPIATN